MARSGLVPSPAHLFVGALLGLAAAFGSGTYFSGQAAAEVAVLEPIRAVPGERVETLELGPGETFGRLLWNATELDGNEQEALLDAFRETASPRRLRTGTRVDVRRLPDGHLRGLDVTLNPDETLRLVREGRLRWAATTRETPVTADTLFIVGTIENVLWTAVVGHPALDAVPGGDRAAILHQLDRIFQWQVDFSRQIREGDRFRFAYEREVRPDGTMRSGRVLIAELVNRETPYHAVRFDPNGDGEGTYYDFEGRSVRRAFLRKPLEFRYISSRFSPRRFHPILERWRSHQGVDYAADRGTPVMATADGVVTTAGRSGGYGNLLEIRHPNGFTTRYGHLNGFASGVRSGARVRQGQVVAYVGATGLATGPHLHYEMRRGDRALDPLAVELPPGDPVPDQERDRWEVRVADRRALLDSVPGTETIRMAEAEGPGTDEPDAERP